MMIGNNSKEWEEIICCTGDEADENNICYMSDKEIVEYYGQIWLNVKHMKSYIKELRKRYNKEVSGE